MDILELIKERFKAGEKTVEVTANEWARFPGVVAGFAHLEKQEQLRHWAIYEGYGFKFDVVRNVFTIQNFKRAL